MRVLHFLVGCLFVAFGGFLVERASHSVDFGSVWSGLVAVVRAGLAAAGGA